MQSARLNVRAAAVWDPRDNVGMKMKIGLGSEKHFSFSATLHSGLCVCFPAHNVSQQTQSHE